MLGRMILFVAGLGISVGGGIGLLIGLMGINILNLPLIFFIVLTSNFLIGFLTGVFWNHIINPTPHHIEDDGYSSKTSDKIDYYENMPLRRENEKVKMEKDREGYTKDGLPIEEDL